jgi:hypothetical protein
MKVRRSEELRIHMDWWGKCRSCQFWLGDRETMADGMCNQPRGDFGGEITTSEGHCGNWESYAIEAAMEIRQAEEEAAAGDSTLMDELRGITKDVPVLVCRFCQHRNLHHLEKCRNCERKYWNDPDDTKMGRTLGEEARRDPDLARAQGRYDASIEKLLESVRKEDDEDPGTH